jgi:uncharacterized protein
MNEALDDYIYYRINKSKETFVDAQLLFDNNRYNSSVNRLYYSAYYLVTALLSSKGFTASSHSGVRIQFNLHFIKTKILLKEYGNSIEIYLNGGKKQITQTL